MTRLERFAERLTQEMDEVRTIDGLEAAHLVAERMIREFIEQAADQHPCACWYETYLDEPEKP